MSRLSRDFTIPRLDDGGENCLLLHFPNSITLPNVDEPFWCCIPKYRCLKREREISRGMLRLGIKHRIRQFHLVFFAMTPVQKFTKKAAPAVFLFLSSSHRFFGVLVTVVTLPSLRYVVTLRRDVTVVLVILLL